MTETTIGSQKVHGHILEKRILNTHQLEKKSEALLIEKRRKTNTGERKKINSSLQKKN